MLGRYPPGGTGNGAARRCVPRSCGDASTLEGEPHEIWTFLGSDRLAAPILEHRPDLVLHGHAHARRLQADLDGVPVYNVSVPVMGQDFWVFELSGAAQAATAIH
jgi:Icc-related predicted phosphoesterase